MAKQDNALGDFLYKEYYLKGRLPSRYSLDKMSRMLGKDKSTISRHLKKLAAKGYIKIDKIPWHGNLINVYDFGTHDGRDDLPYWMHEKIYAFCEIARIEANKDVDKFK